MPAEIGTNHHEIIQHKVNTGASGNVLPLHIFAKCSPVISLQRASLLDIAPLTPDLQHIMDQTLHNLEP